MAALSARRSIATPKRHLGQSPWGAWAGTTDPHSGHWRVRVMSAERPAHFRLLHLNRQKKRFGFHTRSLLKESSENVTRGLTCSDRSCHNRIKHPDGRGCQSASMMLPDCSEAGPGNDGAFTATHWTLVLLAGRSGSAQADAAVASLCQKYWYPLYCYIRRLGHNAADAQDLVQGFLRDCWKRTISKMPTQPRGGSARFS